MVVVEHRMEIALEQADEAMVLANGGIALRTERPRDWITGSSLEKSFFGASLFSQEG
jgi:energy-coupling factor transporter ATP-binding protein EcfA2